MLPRFQQFIRERQYLHNVSPATVSWHTHNLKGLPSDSPTEAELKAMVVRMREKGLRATGCNSAIGSINALKWAGSPLKIPQMKDSRSRSCSPDVTLDTGSNPASFLHPRLQPEFRIGGLKVKLKHVSPRKLVLGTRPAGVAFSALWYVRKQNLTPSAIEKVKRKLPPGEFRFLSESKWAMPAWMADAFYRHERASK